MRALRLGLLAGLLAGCHPNPEDSAPTNPVAATAEAGDPIVAEVGEDVVLDGAGSTGSRFSWSFGDAASAEGLTATHAYAAPGHYVASITATGSDGSVASDTVPVTVHRPLAPQAPSHSNTLAELGGALIAVLPDHDALARIDLATLAVTHTPTCTQPRSVSARDGQLAVACALDEVRVYDADLNELRQVALPYGSRPFGLVWDAAGAIQVSLQGTGEVAGINPANNVLFRPVGPDLRGIAALGDTLLATRHRSADDAGAMYRIDGQTVDAWSLALDPGPDSDTDSRGVPTYLQRIAVSPDWLLAVTGGLKANLGRGLVTDGRALTHESTARGVLRSVSLDPSLAPPGTELGEPQFDDRDLVSSMAFSPLGDWLYVGFLGDGAVDIVDAYTMDRVGGLHGVGIGVDGLWVRDDPAELWVYAELSRELVVFDLTDPFGPQIERARIDLNAGQPDPLDPQLLLGKQTFYNASDPRMTATGYLSCASCHLDGDQDGRTWDFTDRGEGLRNTISLLGRAGSVPIHWTANFDELQDFEGDIRGPMAGKGFLTDADWAATQDALAAPKAGLSVELDAMAAWIESLDTPPRSPFRTSDGSLSPDAFAGQLLFESPLTGCTDCHAPPEYADSAFLGPGLPLLHDVGTLTPDSGMRRGGPLTGLDTPSLRGLHSSAPYLHDGSAATVRAVLERNQATDLHGVTSPLDSTELDQLEAFLLSIE